MQVFVEFLTAVVIWIAAAVLSQFGVEVDLRDISAREERVVERVRDAEPKPVATVCPEQAAKTQRTVARTADA